RDIARERKKSERVSAPKPDDSLVRWRGILRQKDVDRDALVSVGRGDRHQFDMPVLRLACGLHFRVERTAIVRVECPVPPIEIVAHGLVRTADPPATTPRPPV